MFTLHTHPGGNLGYVLLDTLLEFLPVIAVLFLSYLLMEWMEHRMGERAQRIITKAGPFAPAAGALLGCVPQCGFSAAAAGLYAGRVISLGTLYAVFLATSDEMFIIMLTASFSGDFHTDTNTGTNTTRRTGTGRRPPTHTQRTPARSTSSTPPDRTSTATGARSGASMSSASRQAVTVRTGSCALPCGTRCASACSS